MIDGRGLVLGFFLYFCQLFFSWLVFIFNVVVYEKEFFMQILYFLYKQILLFNGDRDFGIFIFFLENILIIFMNCSIIDLIF